MDASLHHVIGLYATSEAARAVHGDLLRAGLQPADLMLRRPGSGEPVLPPVAEGDEPDLALLMQGAGGGVDQAVAQALAEVSLFAASPVLVALMALGWRAALGGLVGLPAASAGTGGEPSDPSSGGAVLVVRCQGARQKALARMIVAASMADAETVTAGVDARQDRPVEGDAQRPLVERAPFDRRRQPDRRTVARLPSGRVQ